MESRHECQPSSSSNPNPANDSPSEKDESSSKWWDLPKDILSVIVARLDWRVHLGRLRGVCSSWRSMLPYSEYSYLFTYSVPTIKPHLPHPLKLLHHRFYLLSPNPNTHDPLDGRWLAKMSEVGNNKRRLFNPVNLHKYFYSHPPISASIQLLDCHIQQLHCGFSLITGSDPVKGLLSKKTVYILNTTSTYQIALLAQLERGYDEPGLFMFSLADFAWIHIRETDTLRVIDIAPHKNKFYVFDLIGWRVGLIDPANPLLAMEFIPAPGNLAVTIRHFRTVTFDKRWYLLMNCHLVPTHGDLYLVVEVAKDLDDPVKTVSMLVFVLSGEGNQEGYSWERVNSLNDHIFFIGYDVSFALPSASTNLPQWRPNSICMFRCGLTYMMEQCKRGKGNMPEGMEPLQSLDYAEYWMYFKIFNLDEEVEGGVLFANLPKRIYTALFFPPPAWVRWRCPSLGNVEVRFDRLRFVDRRTRPYRHFED